MVQTMIVPVTNKQKVDCIVQNGNRYCEDNPLTKKELGISAFAIVGFVLWIGFWLWLSGKLEDKYHIFSFYTFFVGSIVLPALIIGITCLF